MIPYANENMRPCKPVTPKTQIIQHEVVAIEITNKQINNPKSKPTQNHRQRNIQSL